MTAAEIAKFGRENGKTVAEINAVLQQVTDNSYANTTDPDGLNPGDWATGVSPYVMGYDWLFKGKAPAPVRVASRMLGFD